MMNRKTEKKSHLPYISSLENMEPRDFENLCFELLTQMRFSSVEWLKGEFGDADAIATLLRKDPDGFSNQEIWLIFMGTRSSVEKMIEEIPEEMNLILKGLLNYTKVARNVKRGGTPWPITLLLILRERKPDHFALTIKDMEERMRRVEIEEEITKYPFTFRFRVWSLGLLRTLIQDHPPILYKYFSDEARAISKYRKTPEELYKDYEVLTKRLQRTVEELKEEKKKRFIAERDAAWKDVAFKAAHKLGNPLDAVEAFLEALKKRIDAKNLEKAKEICEKMEFSIEEAKLVITQFKSLAKSREIKPKPVRIKKIIEQSCKMAEHKNIMTKINEPEKEKTPDVMVDPMRMTEVFNELVANSLQWLDKDMKEIDVTIEKISKNNVPPELDSSYRYLKIIFADNGRGVPITEKDKIFSPFYTSHPHGTGLGLSMVRWIIDEHGGMIFEEGEPEEGAKFIIFLPIAK